MPIELRRIQFSEDEIVHAAINYCMRAKVRIPDSAVEQVVLDPDGSRMVTLIFHPAPEQGAYHVVLSSPQLLGALVLFCRQNAIPLPRDAEKVLQFRDGALCMLIRFDRKMSERKKKTDTAA